MSRGPDAGSRSGCPCPGWRLAGVRAWGDGHGVYPADSPRVALALDLDRLEDDVLDRPVVAARLHLADLVDDLAAVDDLAEDGVLAFSHGVGTAVMKNCEPLVPGPGVGHGQQVRPVEGRSGWNSSANW